MCPPDPPAPSSPVWSSVLRTIHITAEPTPNVARNSPTTLSNPGIRSLELQRFQTLLKLLPIELRATFLGQAPATAHGHRILALQALRRPPHLWGLVCCWLAQRVSTSHAVQSSPCVASSWRQRYKVRHACEKRAKKGHFGPAGRVLYRACGEKGSAG